MDRFAQHAELLANIHANLDDLEKILNFAESEWVAEDLVYRFWHGSMKVYALQDATTEIHAVLKKLTPSKGEVDPDFVTIIQTGTGKKFDLSVNDDWFNETRPIVDAFFHARYMLSMAVKYGKTLKEAPSILPSGWAALLHLYSIR